MRCGAQMIEIMCKMSCGENWTLNLYLKNIAEENYIFSFSLQWGSNYLKWPPFMVIYWRALCNGNQLSIRHSADTPRRHGVLDGCGVRTIHFVSRCAFNYVRPSATISPSTNRRGLVEIYSTCTAYMCMYNPLVINLKRTIAQWVYSWVAWQKIVECRQKIANEWTTLNGGLIITFYAVVIAANKMEIA